MGKKEIFWWANCHYMIIVKNTLILWDWNNQFQLIVLDLLCSNRIQNHELKICFNLFNWFISSNVLFISFIFRNGIKTFLKRLSLCVVLTFFFGKNERDEMRVDRKRRPLTSAFVAKWSVVIKKLPQIFKWIHIARLIWNIGAAFDQDKKGLTIQKCLMRFFNISVSFYTKKPISKEITILQRIC